MKFLKTMFALTVLLSGCSTLPNYSHVPITSASDVLRNPEPYDGLAICTSGFLVRGNREFIKHSKAPNDLSIKAVFKLDTEVSKNKSGDMVNFCGRVKLDKFCFYSNSENGNMCAPLFVDIVRAKIITK